MTVTDLAAAETRGFSAAAGPGADLTDTQRTYLDRLRADARAAATQRSALDERLAHRSVRATVAVRLADALLAGDERTVATFLPVYDVAAQAEDSSRPGIGIPCLRAV